MWSERGYETGGFGTGPPLGPREWVRSYLGEGVVWACPQGVGGVLMDTMTRNYAGFLPTGERVDVVSWEEFGGTMVGAFRRIPRPDPYRVGQTIYVTEHASREEAHALWLDARARTPAEPSTPPVVRKVFGRGNGFPDFVSPKLDVVRLPPPKEEPEEDGDSWGHYGFGP